MKDIIRKYRNNSLTSEEIKGVRERLDSLTDQQIAETIEDDWVNFEPNPSKSDLEVETRMLERLSANLNIGMTKHSISVIQIIGGIAAVILIGLLSYSTYYFYSSVHNMSLQRFSASTSAEERVGLTLPDGSLVKLNNMSEINYTVGDFTGKSRYVEFNGEAYFDVSKILHKPFIVDTSELEIVVKGTSFNLMDRQGGDMAILSLMEGAVNLTYKKTGQSVELHSDEKATVNYLTGNIIVSRIGENDNPMAWSLRRLTFVNAGFDEIMAQLRIHYGDKIPSIPPREHHERFTGMIPLDNVSVALEIVNTTFPETILN